MNPIFELLRWNKPTGRLILLIPAGWSLWLTPEGNPNLYIVFKILLGGLLVSGFGCIANDIWDKEIDRKVLRTKNRPLASNRINLKVAYFLLLFFISLSFLLTLSLPVKGRILSLILAFIALPLVLIYPSAKRWFKFPQLILSICWGFAVLIPWAAHEGNLQSGVLLFCWLATIFWTFGFDTVYALADRKYDLQLGINSSAIHLKSNTKITIQICYLITSLSLSISALLNNASFIFWPILIVTSLFMQNDILKLFNPKNELIKEVGIHFRNEVIYGCVFLIGIIIS
ncbi:MAG: 4-hydroxybenzoate octaprenyltransferase [Prochlorococcus sp. SP3034]|nr:4-hydroxybenzoate octaprenyltransferase [Prochlorococcus sp. SP3034]|tara:strand:+ start:3685 stop:4542 length:858 start_codon:yes stop_codon:yes gene_type:complete